MKKIKLLLYLLILLSIGASSSRSQTTPKIDHLEIDNGSGRLAIIGKFGNTPGYVQIDSLSILHQSWSPDTIICIINDTGAGSCGPVQVTTPSGHSNERTLTRWSIDDNVWQTTHGPANMDRHFYFHIPLRLDLGWSISRGSFEFYSERTATIEDTIGYYSLNHPRSYDTIYRGCVLLKFDSTRHMVTMPSLMTFSQMGYSYDCPSPFKFGPKYAGSSYDWGPSTMYEGYVSDHVNISSTFLPPDSELDQTYASINRNTGHIGNVTLYPTPCDRSLTLGLPTNEPADIEIRNLLGKIVHRLRVVSDESSIDCSGWPEGVYFVSVNVNSSHLIRKLIVAH